MALETVLERSILDAASILSQNGEKGMHRERKGVNQQRELFYGLPCTVEMASSNLVFARFHNLILHFFPNCRCAIHTEAELAATRIYVHYLYSGEYNCGRYNYKAYI